MKNLSIIIPVYNGEKYIDRCLSSILNIKDIEIIIVDDCSTDSSYEILCNYSSKYPNIKLLHNTSNLGVSATRNKALKQATGKYILFLDIDDYLVDNASQTIESLCQTNYDYINFGVISKKNNQLKYNAMPYIGNLATKDLLYKNIKIFLDVNISTWIKNKLYNQKIINQHNIRFNENMSFSEDMKFNLDFIIHSNNLYFSNEYLMIYDRDIPNSLSRQFESKNISEYFKQRQFLSQFFIDNNITISEEYYLDCVGLLTYDVFKVINSNGSQESKIQEVSLLLSNDISYLLPYFNTNDSQELAIKQTIINKDIKYLINYKE